MIVNEYLEQSELMTRTLNQTSPSNPINSVQNER